MSKTRSEARRALSPASVLSVAEAVRELGGRQATVKAWLRRQGLVSVAPGLGERVIWGDVLDRIRDGEGPQEEPPRPAATLRRAGLGQRRR